MKYKQQSAENEGGEMNKNQQIMATVAVIEDKIQTQQSTKHIDVVKFKRVRLVGEEKRASISIQQSSEVGIMLFYCAFLFLLVGNVIHNIKHYNYTELLII